MGIIIRTVAQGASESELTEDYRAACMLWEEIAQRAKHAKAPKLIHSDGNLTLRLVRDLLDESVTEVYTDGEVLYREALHFAEMLAPEQRDKIILHDGETPLFDIYRVDAQADKAMNRHIWLKSGGSIVIDETEAMTVVDVNTGKYVGRKSFDETVFKLNCEAAREIARLIRLRDIGGIIIIDFIDMQRAEARDALLKLLRELTASDRNRTNVLGFTGLGLIEMTRKKVRRPITKQLMHMCPSCSGQGLVPSYETTARRILRELWVRNRASKQGALLVEASAPVAGWLLTLGAPEGMKVYAAARQDLPEQEYRILPADERALPEGSKLLK